jgi:serine/threonine-protein kinase
MPIKIDIAAGKRYSLVASKKGFEDYRQDITFEDGQAEKTFVISLLPATEPETKRVAEEPAPRARPSQPAQPANNRSKAVNKRAAAPEPDEEEPEPAPSKGSKGESGANGTLSISSSPASTVVLDGKPLGSTPQGGISVAPGPHTVLFVHPDYGRKSRTIVVQAGKSASASVKFP